MESDGLENHSTCGLHLFTHHCLQKKVNNAGKPGLEWEAEDMQHHVPKEEKPMETIFESFFVFKALVLDSF